MARYFVPGKPERQVAPAHGEFSHEELRKLIDGPLTGHTLTRDKEGLYMWLDETSLLTGKPKNTEATKVLHQYRENLSHITIFGNALITTLEESGE
jgi:hypothetical protein